MLYVPRGVEGPVLLFSSFIYSPLYFEDLLESKYGPFFETLISESPCSFYTLWRRRSSVGKSVNQRSFERGWVWDEASKNWIAVSVSSCIDFAACGSMSTGTTPKIQKRKSSIFDAN